MRRKYDMLQRDNFVCTICLCDNFERPLHVHHITYLKGRKAWEYEDWFLVTLCANCHNAEHDKNNTDNLKSVMVWVRKLLGIKNGN